MTGISQSELLLEVLYSLKDCFEKKSSFFSKTMLDLTLVCEVAIKMLKELDIVRLSWPSQSPYISPIENLWLIIRQELWKKRDLIHNVNDCWKLSQEICEKVTTEHKLSPSIHTKKK